MFFYYHRSGWGSLLSIGSAGTMVMYPILRSVKVKGPVVWDLETCVRGKISHFYIQINLLIQSLKEKKQLMHPYLDVSNRQNVDLNNFSHHKQRMYCILKTGLQTFRYFAVPMGRVRGAKPGSPVSPEIRKSISAGTTNTVVKERSSSLYGLRKQLKSFWEDPQLQRGNGVRNPEGPGEPSEAVIGRINEFFHLRGSQEEFYPGEVKTLQ